MKVIATTIIILILQLCFVNFIYAENTNPLDIVTSMILKKTNYDGELLIDYSVEIIKKDPTSFETYATLSLLKKAYQDQKIIDKINSLKSNFMSTVDDFNSNPAEKLMLIYLIGIGMHSYNDENISDNTLFFINTLNKIRDTCKNENYSALATLLLFLDKNDGLKYMNLFKNTYKNHPFIPLVELNIISEYSSNKQYQKCIDEAKKWIENNKNLISPYGWHIYIEAYALIAYCYIASKEYENAKHYLDLIKNEAPSYHELDNLNQLLSFYNE